MPISGSWFKEWFNSPYYHQLYINRDEKEAAAFIHLLLARLHPPAGALMVDIACGRGRHAKILAAEGYDVTGIDLSPASIDFARRFETDRLHFYQHDMRLPFWINYFDYAFNFFTSFGYFNTRREHYNAIRTIAQSLRPNGYFVLDYLNVDYAEECLVNDSEKEIEGVAYRLTKWHDTTHFYKKIIVEDPKLPQPLEFTEKVAKFRLDDFTEMFSFHHLQVQDVYGNYQLGPYDTKTSPRLIIIAKKEGN